MRWFAAIGGGACELHPCLSARISRFEFRISSSLSRPGSALYHPSIDTEVHPVVKSPCFPASPFFCSFSLPPHSPTPPRRAPRGNPCLIQPATCACPKSKLG